MIYSCGNCPVYTTFLLIQSLWQMLIDYLYVLFQGGLCKRRFTYVSFFKVAEMSVTLPNKSPPIWPDDRSFGSWNTEIEMWLVITDIQVDKRAPTIVLTLQGRKREVARQVPIGDLNHEDGVTRLLAKLAEYFAKDTVDSAYEAYVKFEELKRQPTSSIAD